MTKNPRKPRFSIKPQFFHKTLIFPLNPIFDHKSPKPLFLSLTPPPSGSLTFFKKPPVYISPSIYALKTFVFTNKHLPEYILNLALFLILYILHTCDVPYLHYHITNLILFHCLMRPFILWNITVFHYYLHSLPVLAAAPDIPIQTYLWCIPNILKLLIILITTDIFISIFHYYLPISYRFYYLSFPSIKYYIANWITYLLTSIEVFNDFCYYSHVLRMFFTFSYRAFF